MIVNTTLDNVFGLKGFKGLNLLNWFKPTTKAFIEQHGGCTRQFAVLVQLEKLANGNQYGEVEPASQTVWVRSKRLSLSNTSEIKSNIKIAQEVLIDKISNSQIIKGSGWLFVKILKVNIGLAKYKPMAGSSYIELPKELVAKRAVINVQNKDNECFKWAMLSALFPASTKAERVSKHKNLVHNIDFCMLTYPVSIDNIHKFEKKNNIGINLYRSQILQSKLKTENETK